MEPHQSDRIRIVKALIKSLWSRRLNRALVGRVWHHQLPPVTAEAAHVFARATTTDALAPPLSSTAPRLFLLKLAIEPFKELCFDPDLRLKFWQLVHAGQQIRWCHPIQIGAKIRLEAKIQSIRDTSAGELMRVALRCWSDDRLAVTGVSDLMVRRKAKTPPATGAVPSSDKAPPELLRTEIQTEPWQSRAYAAASGDCNPIHTRPWAARLAGLPGPIMHGACVLAMITDRLAQLGRDDWPAGLASIRGRFSHPVIPGQKLTLVVNAGSGERARSFRVLNPHSKIVFDHGLLKYAPVC